MSELTKGGLRAYARHRYALGLPGGSHQAVQRAIDRQRLFDSLTKVDGAIEIDFAKADREWSDNTQWYKMPLKLQIRDDERIRRRQQQVEVEEVFPVEHLSVDEMDPGIIGVGAWFDLDDRRESDPRDQFFLVDVAAARWLAGELLRLAERQPATEA